ncbi:MAG: AAA family ATPase, partial [Myxococcota bacterium]
DCAPLVGRETVVGALGDRVRAALAASTPALLSVLAPAGYGKSALIPALARALAGADSERDAGPAPVIVHIQPEHSVGSGPSDVAHLLSVLLLGPDAGDVRPDKVHAAAVQRLARISGRDDGDARFIDDPSSAAVLGLAAGALPGDHRDLAAIAAAPGALALAVTRIVGALIIDAARTAALVILCDDAQLASDELLDVLEYVTRADVTAPLCVCALARPGLTEARPSWGERAASHQRFELAALDRAALTELIIGQVGHQLTVPAAVVDWLVAHTRGVPLLAVELIRAIARAGLIRRWRAADAWFFAVDELPDITGLATARWLAERELAALTPALVGHAQLCAILGVEVDTDEVAGVLTAYDRMAVTMYELSLDAAVGLRGLVAAGLLQRVGADRYRFRHGLIRDAVVELIGDALARRIRVAALAHYRAVAAALGDSIATTTIARLVEHAAALDLAEAGQLCLMRACAARLRSSFVAAERLFSRALSTLPVSARHLRMIAYRGRGQMRFRLDRHDDAGDDF